MTSRSFSLGNSVGKKALKKRQVSNWQNFYHLFLAKLDQLICFCPQLISQPSVLFLDEFLFLLNSLFTELRQKIILSLKLVPSSFLRWLNLLLHEMCSQRSPCGINGVLSNIICVHQTLKA